MTVPNPIQTVELVVDETANVGLTYRKGDTSKNVLLTVNKSTKVIVTKRSAAPPAPSPPPPSPSPPPPSPSPSSGSYRDAHTRLFQTAGAQQIPSRLPGGGPYDYGNTGPTGQYVDKFCDWVWTNPFGDWLDANQVSQGTTDWASTVASSAGLSAGHAPVANAINITTALQFVQANNRHCAFMLKSGGAPRVLAGRTYPDQTKAPYVAVVYADGTTANLACWCFTTLGTSQVAQTALSTVGLPSNAQNAVIEFDRPNKPVQSATLHFWCTEQNWSGSPQTILVTGVANPPLRKAVVGGGVAASAGFADTNMAANPNAIYVHRYPDGEPQSATIDTGIGYTDANFDPAIWGGAQDLSKFPHSIQGKWTLANLPKQPPNLQGNLTKIDSTFTGHGFVPLAPGVGAIMSVCTGRNVQDGDQELNAGNMFCQARLPLPFDRIGLQRHMRIRYYRRRHMESKVGDPRTPTNRKHIYSSGTPRWTDRSGKTGIGFNHDTYGGGFSGTSGGDKGWQMRLSWYEADNNMGGPNEAGESVGYHLYDYLGNNPPGHRYGSADYYPGERFGQRGGFGGHFEFDRWYCIEHELKLNSVDRPGPDGRLWTPDGELRTWVDGRLVYERTGMVFRALPYVAGESQPSQNHLTPMRELGVRELILNEFYGGQSDADCDIASFYALLVVADGSMGYIGPAAGVILPSE